MSRLPLSEIDDLMGVPTRESYSRTNIPVKPRIKPIKSKVLTMDGMDGMMPSFGTYIRTPEAEREALCENWCKAREPVAGPITTAPTGTAEVTDYLIRYALSQQPDNQAIEVNEPVHAVGPKIKYCDEPTCAVPNCGLFEHKGSIPRTKCGCGCPE